MIRLFVRWKPHAVIAHSGGNDRIPSFNVDGLRQFMRNTFEKSVQMIATCLQARVSLLSLIVALGLGGCASESFSPEAAPEYVIVAEFAAFYRLGPQQPRGPDQSLRQGTRVKLLRREMGFSCVHMEDLQSGYVANESMEVAPPRPKEPDAAAATSGSGGSRKPGNRQRAETSPVYSGPQFNDTPLPDPNVPPPDLNIDPEVVPDTIPVPSATPSGTPKFRY